MRRAWLFALLIDAGCTGMPHARIAWPSPPAPIPTPPARKSETALKIRPLARQHRTSIIPQTQLPQALDRRIYFRWPLQSTGINSFYGPRPDPLHAKPRFHHGIDLGAQYGQIVQATAPGKVVHAGWHGGHGRQVILRHPGGYESRYSHLSSIFLEVGMVITAGAPIGRAGNSGRSTGPHLHFEIAHHGARQDPLSLLGRSIFIDNP